MLFVVCACFLFSVFEFLFECHKGQVRLLTAVERMFLLINEIMSMPSRTGHGNGGRGVLRAGLVVWMDRSKTKTKNWMHRFFRPQKKGRLVDPYNKNKVKNTQYFMYRAYTNAAALSGADFPCFDNYAERPIFCFLWSGLHPCRNLKHLAKYFQSFSNRNTKKT